MKPNRNQIQSIAKGKIPFILQGVPFIIIHELVKMKLSQETSWEWAFAVSPKEEEHVTIDRQTALDIIREHNMAVCHKQKEGQIYETPERPFYDQFKNYFAINTKRQEA